MNDIMLKDRMFDEFGVREGDFRISAITTKTSGKYGMTTSGKYINSKGELVGGYALGFSSGYTESLHISPYYATSIDNVAFRAVAGHELIHAYHNYAIPGASTIYSEKIAYKYTHDTYVNSGRYWEASQVMKLAASKLFWGTAPAQYQIPSAIGIYW